jgi:hypothetical protein
VAMTATLMQARTKLRISNLLRFQPLSATRQVKFPN